MHYRKSLLFPIIIFDYKNILFKTIAYKLMIVLFYYTSPIERWEKLKYLKWK